MKRIIALTLLLSLFLMYGCFLPTEVDDVTGVVLISNEGEINSPTINDQPMGYSTYQPGQALLVSFVPSVDQYGDTTGVSNSKYTVKNAEFKMPSKNGELDTIFWVAGLPRNKFKVVPGWTGKINTQNGFPFAPFIGWLPYQFDCKMDYGSQLPGGMPSQTAELYVEAEALWMEVQFVAEDMSEKHPGGYYRLDVAYSERSDINKIDVKLETPGEYSVSYYDRSDNLVKTWNYVVPASWFWIDNLFYINVGGNSQCGNDC